MKNLNDQTENSSIIHQNTKLEKEFKLTTNSEIIGKNNYLKNLYFIGFNSKPVNKAIMNSINFTEAVSTIKSFLDSEDLTIKLCGSLVLGLCKIYEKKIKIYYEELENMLRINKDKKTLKAEKMQEDKIKNNITFTTDNYNANAENEKSKIKKSGKKGIIEAKNKNNSTSVNAQGNLNSESHYDDMFLSTNLNLNTNSKSIRDFSLDNNNTKRIFNLYDISELNSEMTGSVTKLNLNSLERSQLQQQINTPSKIRNLFDVAGESSQSKMEFLRARNSNIPSAAENLDSHSRFLNSANHLVNGLVDRSNMEDEMFNKNLNNYFLKIVSDEKMNFENIDNLFQADDVGNFANEDYNQDFHGHAEERKMADLTGKNANVVPKKLIFPELKNKLELDLDKAENEFDQTIDAGMFKSLKKSKPKGKNKKTNFEVDRQIYLSLELPKKIKEDKKIKRMKFGAENNWEKLDYQLPGFLELKEKFKSDIYAEYSKESLKQKIIKFDKDLNKSLLPMNEINQEFESESKAKEDQYRSMILNIKDSLFQNKHNINEFLDYAKETIPHDPADVFDINENLEEKVNELFKEEDNIMSFLDPEVREESVKKNSPQKDDLKNLEDSIDEKENKNYNIDNDNEDNFSLNRHADIFRVEEGEEAAEKEALKTEQINSNIDKDILDFLKRKKKAKDINFKEVNEKMNHDSANVFYRMLCLAQREKINIIQNEVCDAEQTFIKLC